MASRPKRVSLKGKGADIFFGDYAPSTDAPEAETEQMQPPAIPSDQPAAELVAERLPAPDSRAEPTDSASQASMQESKKESSLSSKNERVKASKQAAARSRTGGKLRTGAGGIAETPAMPEKITDEVWASVETPATITNSFRYTEAELEAVADVLYDIGRNRGPRLTKQDIARLGLNVVLDDYRRRGPASLLGQLAARRRPRHAG